MKRNGTAVGAYAEQIGELLAGVTALDYYREPQPAARDVGLDESVAWYMRANAAERAMLCELLPDYVSPLLGIYAHRAATRALNTESPDLLEKGMVAWTIASESAVESRRLEITLVIFHHCARTLGLVPADLFAQVAEYASSEVASVLIRFGNRADVTLKQYGWQVQHTPDGLQFKYGWK